MGKIVSKEEFIKIREELSKDKRKIILCHGVFDLIHPGHIVHFEEAKGLGDILVVSVTGANYVRKGPGRPYFNDELRLKFLSSIKYIDYILLSESYTVDDIVECVQPQLYVKGGEYSEEANDITGEISNEIELVRKYGGDVYFTSGQVFSSTKLINNFMNAVSDEVKSFMFFMKDSYGFTDIKKYIEDMESLNVFVLGDVIIDRYTFCDVQGLMSKDRGYSVKYRNQDSYLGGAVAIARHIAQFSKNVTFASVIGNERNIHSRLLNDLGKDMRVYVEYSDRYPTVEKERFIAINEKREEFDKLFSINKIPDDKLIDGDEREEFKRKIEEMIPEYDLVVLCDFGHGLIDNEIINIAQKKSKFLAVNCQTNSANYGMNLLTKFSDINMFSLDQKELRLAFHDKKTSEVELLKKMIYKTNAEYGFLTQASHGATVIKGESECVCPALTLRVKDTVGAGDAFFAIVSLCSALGLSESISVFMGNVAGALAANIMGNEKPVEKVDFLKYISTLMNF